MNGDEILLDTNAFIYFFEGRARIAEYILLADTIYYSVISEIELLSAPHLSEADILTIQGFLARCRRVDLSGEIVQRTITIRRVYGLKTPDAIIAATALFLNVSLYTADKKFGLIEELKVVTEIID